VHLRSGEKSGWNKKNLGDLAGTLLISSRLGWPDLTTWYLISAAGDAGPPPPAASTRSSR
jgi:hypothetical protein